MRPDVWGRFQERFGVPKVCEFYGSTEGGLSHLTIQEGDYLRNAVGHDGLVRRWQLRNQIVPVLVDAETNDIVRDPQTGLAVRMPYEIGGELLFRLESEANFVGYWKNQDATEKKFARDVFRKGDLWYRSGDSLKRDSEGKWSFLDRLGDTYRWKGENVSTAEVSECLGAYPGVVDANVYGVQVPNHDGRAGCASLMLSPEVSGNFDIEGLLRYAAYCVSKQSFTDTTQTCPKGPPKLCSASILEDRVIRGVEFDWLEARQGPAPNGRR